MNRLTGVFLPIVTPFKGGEVDYQSYRNLIRHYIKKGIHGLIPLGTTGESPVITGSEYMKIIEVTLEEAKGRLPVFAGIGSNNTAKAVSMAKRLEPLALEGFLVTSPYYNLPSQEGIYTHFLRISETTNKKIILYNIPYRTGRNMSNETIYRLAEHKNITGLKDSCGDIKQTLQLLNAPPEDFSLFTGEDHLFFTNLLHGGAGGILASAHINTEKFLAVYNHITDNNHKEALSLWNSLYPIIPKLFKEPNPGPLKFLLKEWGLIASEKTREPLTPITEPLKRELLAFSL